MSVLEKITRHIDAAEIVGIILCSTLYVVAFAAYNTTKRPVYSRERLAAYATARTLAVTVVEKPDAKGARHSYSGAGVFVTPNGHVLTCAHLFRHNTDFVQVEDENGNISQAEVLFVEPKRDLAMLATAFTNTEYAPIADPRTVLPGDDILISGSPLGLTFSVCHGIISAVGRDLPLGYNLVQSDAMVNPGNSGGPAFNEFGEIVGIVSFFEFDKFPVNSGLSFLVSAAQIREFFVRFKGFGKLA